MADDSDNEITLCKCCLMQKTKEEVGVISETIVNQMLSRLTNNKVQLPTQNLTPLRTCNDCVIDLLKADDLIIISRDSEGLLKCWWKMSLQQRYLASIPTTSEQTEEEEA